MKPGLILPLVAILCLGLAGSPSPAQQAANGNPTAAPQEPAAKTFFIRLIPPRTTFLQDMTDAESKLMEAHYAYWSDQFAKGVCLFGGPVLDPKGVYGVLVVKAPNDAEAHAIAADDPSVKGGLNRIEVVEMHIAFLARSH